MFAFLFRNINNRKQKGTTRNKSGTSVTRRAPCKDISFIYNKAQIRLKITVKELFLYMKML